MVVLSCVKIMKEFNDKIVLDLDRDRIKTVIREAYKISREFLSTEFQISVDDFVSKINPYLDSNRVTIPVTLYLPSKKYPGMKIEVDLRRKKVFARLHPPSKQATLNHMLGAL
jgi:hypothetical protein